MTLEYKILWFEDESGWYDAMLPNIEEFLSKEGFTICPQREDNGKGIELSNYNLKNYDLFLIDYQLVSELGDALIKQIRNLDVYTDIVFYSQKGETQLRADILNQGVDGVYCSDREEGEFVEKVTKVINTTIKKVIDLNNVRGLVLANTSEFDVRMAEIIKLTIENLSSDKNTIHRKKISDMLRKSYSDRIEKLPEVSSEEFNKLYDEIESIHKWRTVKRLCKEHPKTQEFVEELNGYEAEIILIRNILGHVREELDENGKKILRSHQKGHEAFVFDDATALEIRKNIIKYAKLFDTIISLLKS